MKKSRAIVRRTARWAMVLPIAAGPAIASGATTTLYSFTGGADGAVPTTSVTLDTAGNIYGETSAGANLCPVSLAGSVGCGTVYRLSRSGKLTTLATFTGPNGATGFGQLALSGKTLYGSTYLGGVNDDGILFSVGTDGSKFTILHQFDGQDGANPLGPLLLSAGELYGVASTEGPGFTTGGRNAYGVLFKITRDGQFYPLHFFDGKDGSSPSMILIDKTGTIYGSTDVGGTACAPRQGCGTIFSYVPSTGQFTSLYQFSGEADGEFPSLGSVSSTGVLYGATSGRGSHNEGTIFELVPSAGTYELTTLYAFGHEGLYGADPGSGPIVLPGGALVGTALSSLYLYDTSLENNGAILGTFPSSSAGTEPSIGPDGVLYGVTSGGGSSACVSSSGIPISGDGCGTIYAYSKPGNVR